jgi:hypothetical protein
MRILAACSALLIIHSVQADTIADWTFENFHHSHHFHQSGTDPSMLLPPGSAVWEYHALSNSSFSGIPGFGSTHSMSADNWSIGDFFEFQTSTFGYTNIAISFDQFRSSSGPLDWNFEYSTNGSLFTTALTYSATNLTAWTVGAHQSIYTFSVDLSSLSALANDTNVYFRIVADSVPGGTAGTSGVNNFLVSGNPIPVPEPSSAALVGLAGFFCARFETRSRRSRN